MKKVLMIFHGFPPVVGSATQRKIKFAKYLPSSGWKPIVLAVKSWGAPFYDHTNMEEISPQLKIYRTHSIEPLRLINLLRKKLSKNDSSGSGLPHLHGEKSLFRKVKDFLYKCIFIPDTEIGWMPFALFTGLKIVRNEGVDVIFSSSFPMTCHLVAYLLKKITRITWVADFRDPWTHRTIYPYRGQFRHRIDKYIERKILFYCDKIIANTPGNKKDLIHYFQVPEEKVVVIPNGFDSSDFPDNISNYTGQKFVIIHSGSLYTIETLKGFFRAIEKLCAEKPELEKKMEVIFRGGFEKTGVELLRQLNLPKVFRLEKNLPHKKNIESLMRCDLLLVNLYPGEKSWIPGKLYEYLNTGRPILALISEGNCADLIRKTGTGIVVDPDDSERIVDVIYDFYRKWESGNLTINPNWNLIKQFERKTLTERLANVFEECLGKT